ncbi:MAG: SpoIIE family protein phosphatase [Bacteroidales bacterium]
MKREYKYFIVEMIIGALIGFFFLHPISMLINGGLDAIFFSFKNGMHHLLHSAMSWYFTLIGMILATVTAISRITIRRKNFLLEKQKKEIQEKNVELEQQKEEIQAQAENLLEANEEITAQNNEITVQKDLITKQHEDLTSSIRYAKVIQTAMLSTQDFIKTKLPNSFVLLMPKDIVSGDFYWFTEKNNYQFLAAVDCTGHGVPGAFMSMVGNQLLNHIILEMEILETDLILQEMNTGIKKFLKHDETDARDGMDMTICRIDPKKKELEFSGAGNPMYILQNGELVEIKGDTRPIGGFSRDAEHFTKHVIKTDIPTNIYLFSDGYSDQFCGKDLKKFGRKKFRELLTEISHLKFDEQKEKLISAHFQWRENQRQTDDILVLGVKV